VPAGATRASLLVSCQLGIAGVEYAELIHTVEIRQR
jgi:hypothetical protein